ncbi:hypothetical protein [Fervidobacterium sp.]
MLEAAPPVFLVGAEEVGVEVDPRQGLVWGLGWLYGRLGVRPNDVLSLRATPDGVVVEVVERPQRRAPGRVERPEEKSREARAQGEAREPKAVKRVVRLFPDGREEVVLRPERAEEPPLPEARAPFPAPPSSPPLAEALLALERAGFRLVDQNGERALLVSPAGPLLFYGAAPASPPGPGVAWAHLGPGERSVDLEALEALAQRPVAVAGFLKRLSQGRPVSREAVLALAREAEEVLERRAALTALFLHLDRAGKGALLTLAELEEAVPGAKSLLPALEAEPFRLLKQRGLEVEVTRSPREAASEAGLYLEALLDLLARARGAAVGGR